MIILTKIITINKKDITMNEIIGGIILISVYLTTMFVTVQVKKDNSIGNFTWGGGVLLVTLYTYYYGFHTPRSLLITTLIFLWATRLIVSRLRISCS